MSGTFHTPLSGGIAGRTFNATLHGHSRYRPKSVPGHNVVTGWAAGNHDGLDIFCPAGTDVITMFAGRVKEFRQRGGVLSAVIIRDSSGNEAVYAHCAFPAWLRQGDLVGRGKVIGQVSGRLNHPHLHLELVVGGKPIAAKWPDILADEIRSYCTVDGK